MNMRFLVVGASVLLLGVAGVANAKVRSVYLEDLVRRSDVIILAAVTGIRGGPAHTSVASARVVETWKGRPGAVVDFRASPSWDCDTSSASMGETAVLFLSAPGENGFRNLVHSGRGRMPVHITDGLSYAMLWSSDVLLPEGTPTIAAPDGRHPLVHRSVTLGRLKHLVRQSSAASGPLRRFKYRGHPSKSFSVPRGL